MLPRLTLLRLWRLAKSPVWKAAKAAVRAVRDDEPLQGVAVHEEKTSFCPRCGQVPDGDRRMDEARERALAQLPDAVLHRSDLDFAIAWHYWRTKN